MKGIDVLRLVLVGVLAVHAENAQTRAYGKFGPAGETIGLFNLLRDSRMCGEWRTYAGAVRDMRRNYRNRSVTYRFAIRTSASNIILEFTLDRDDIPEGDVENLLARTHKVSARACRSGNRTWAVEEITRIESH